MTEILEQLKINNSFLTEFSLFIIFFFLLSALYLRPVQKIILSRRKAFEEDAHASVELLKSIETRLEGYEKQLTQARHEALQTYEATIQGIKASEDVKINQVKDELKRDYLKATQQLQEERLKIEAELKTQVTQLADALSEKALGGK